MVVAKHYDLRETLKGVGGRGVTSKHATHLMELHGRVRQLKSPVVLECGVHLGVSTGVLAHAVEAADADGRLISLDIDDCSDAIQANCWTFLQISDTEKEQVLQAAPILRQGIDLLLIDSWHAVRHVRRVMELWYPLVKRDGWIAFHDVDPGPFMRGQPKDNIESEIVWRDKAQMILDFFYANEDDLLLEIHYGDMGMAIMQKLAPMDKPPQPPRRIKPRRTSFYSLARRLRGRD